MGVSLDYPCLTAVAAGRRPENVIQPLKTKQAPTFFKLVNQLKKLDLMCPLLVFRNGRDDYEVIEFEGRLRVEQNTYQKA